MNSCQWFARPTWLSNVEVSTEHEKNRADNK